MTLWAIKKFLPGHDYEKENILWSPKNCTDIMKLAHAYLKNTQQKSYNHKINVVNAEKWRCHLFASGVSLQTFHYEGAVFSSSAGPSLLLWPTHQQTTRCHSAAIRWETAKCTKKENNGPTITLTGACHAFFAFTAVRDLRFD